MRKTADEVMRSADVRSAFHQEPHEDRAAAEPETGPVADDPRPEPSPPPRTGRRTRRPRDGPSTQPAMRLILQRLRRSEEARNGTMTLLELLLELGTAWSSR